MGIILVECYFFTLEQLLKISRSISSYCYEVREDVYALMEMLVIKRKAESVGWEKQVTGWLVKWHSLQHPAGVGEVLVRKV
jgi:hypothetical protein